MLRFWWETLKLSVQALGKHRTYYFYFLSLLFNVSEELYLKTLTSLTQGSGRYESFIYEQRSNTKKLNCFQRQVPMLMQIKQKC